MNYQLGRTGFQVSESGWNRIFAKF